MSKSSKKVEMVTLKRVGKSERIKNTQGQTIKKPIDEATKILRMAANSNVRTWELDDSSYKFEDNEIVRKSSKGDSK